VSHPTNARLALYAGGELGPWARFRVARHLPRCLQCRGEVDEFRRLREFLEGERGELPAGVDWSELAAKVTVNVRRGLAASQRAGEPAWERFGMPWRAPALALPVLLVVVAGWILQSLPPPLRPLPAPGAGLSPVVLDAGPAGIGLERDGRGFRLLHPRAEEVVFSVRGESVRSRYVDGETGQVTISHVYAE